jgi:hypothetical protein
LSTWEGDSNALEQGHEMLASDWAEYCRQERVKKGVYLGADHRDGGLGLLLNAGQVNLPAHRVHGAIDKAHQNVLRPGLHVNDKLVLLILRG